MYWNKVKPGSLLLIENNLFEVLKILGEVHYNPQTKSQREFTSYELYKHRSNSIMPTHELNVYHDNQEIKMVTRTSGGKKNFVHFGDWKTIDVKDIVLKKE